MRPGHFAALALTFALTLALTSPALASGINCFATPLGADCQPLPDGAPIDRQTLFRVECEASMAEPEGEQITEFEPELHELGLDIAPDDPTIEPDAVLIEAEACADDAAVFAIEGCLPPGTFTIRHVDGAGLPELAVDAPTCAPDGEGGMGDGGVDADADGGGGCQQGRGSAPAWPMALLLAGLLRRRAAH